ncbi:hypothetical protein [Methanoculleus caldifontis]|nr:hypothetical protein [Methanoculleus sp. Wushi-C6]
MSKHHANALIFLGIAACAGFLLSVPAVAGSGQGLQVLESGELFLSPFSNLTAPGNGSGPSGSPALPDEEEISDAPAAPLDTGSPDLPTGMETVTPADPETGSEPVDPAPLAGTPSGGTGGYDDERLARLINTAGISLMRLSMEHAHALYMQDADAAAVAADGLHALSIRLLAEVQPLQVSSGQQPVKDEFIRSLSAYTTASQTLLDSTAATKEEAVPVALRDLATASGNLETVSRQAVSVQPIDTGSSTSDATVLTVETSRTRTGTGTAAPPTEPLRIGERYTYDDQPGENMISLLADSARVVKKYETAAVNGSMVMNEADEGRAFFLVAVKATNLGHKGDSDLYTIETPGRDAFVLEQHGMTYAPLEAPPFTSLGESFDRKMLDRYQTLKGYLYFDVPATFEVSGATLRAELGYAGTPAWGLEREAGNASAV